MANCNSHNKANKETCTHFLITDTSSVKQYVLQSDVINHFFSFSHTLFVLDLHFWLLCCQYRAVCASQGGNYAAVLTFTLCWCCTSRMCSHDTTYPQSQMLGSAEEKPERSRRSWTLWHKTAATCNICKIMSFNEFRSCSQCLYKHQPAARFLSTVTTFHVKFRAF